MEKQKLIDMFDHHQLPIKEIYKATGKSTTGTFVQWVIVHEHKPDKEAGGTGVTAELWKDLLRFQREQKSMNMVVKSTETVAFMEEQLDVGEFTREYVRQAPASTPPS